MRVDASSDEDEEGGEDEEDDDMASSESSMTDGMGDHDDALDMEDGMDVDAAGATEREANLVGEAEEFSENLGLSDEDDNEDSGEDEDEDLGREVEAVHQPLPVLGPRRAVEPEVGEAHHADPRLKHVEHLGHLREDEAAVAAAVQLAQQPREHLQLAAIPL